MTVEKGGEWVRFLTLVFVIYDMGLIINESVRKNIVVNDEDIVIYHEDVLVTFDFEKIVNEFVKKKIAENEKSLVKFLILVSKIILNNKKI